MMKKVFLLLSFLSIHLFSICYEEEIYYDDYDSYYIDCCPNDDVVIHHHYDYDIVPDYAPPTDIIVHHYSEPPISYDVNYPKYLLNIDSHLLLSAAYNGEWIQLEDGSVWSVTSYYGKKEVLDWKATDPLYIYPNNALFSFHKYKIVNDKWNTSVEISLLRGPDAARPENRKLITFIDYKNSAVYLSDNTIWYVASDDSSIVKNWEVNDPVMIGSYKAFFSSYKNILINLYETKSKNAHVKVKL